MLGNTYIFTMGFVFITCLSGLSAQSPYYQNKKEEFSHVQQVLASLSHTEPHMVSYLPETGRWFLNDPRTEVIPEDLLIQLQNAFYWDVEAICKFYGEKYLINWRVLISKAARETCWGASILCNYSFNYFGIRRSFKPWMCENFKFCSTVQKDDPNLVEFVVFPNFEASLWMFIHTIYSQHYLDRLPDRGARVASAIEFERGVGLHYWERSLNGVKLATQLRGNLYTIEDIIFTWSEHQELNLCASCTRRSDREWVYRIEEVAYRARR